MQLGAPRAAHVWLYKFSGLLVTASGFGSLGYPRRVRIIKTDDFSSVFNFRKRISGHFLVIHYQKNQLGWARLGLVTAKKITSLSVDRNYMKRVLRELFRRQQRRLKSLDLIIRVQKTFDSADFPAVEKEFVGLLAKSHCRAEPGATKHQANNEQK